MAAAKPSIQVDVTSDTVCPWCYVGKKNIERAIEEVKDKYDVQVGALSYESKKEAWTASGGKKMILSKDSTSGFKHGGSEIRRITGRNYICDSTH